MHIAFPGFDKFSVIITVSMSEFYISEFIGTD